jgi:hypothetical protein
MDKILQTTVSEPVAAEIQGRAAADGVSVAAWVRRAVLRMLSTASVEAWVVPADQANAPIEQDRPSTHLLLEVQRLSATEAVYTLAHGRAHDHPGALVTIGWLTGGHTADHAWYVAPEKFRFRLRGSSKPWRIVSTMLEDMTQEVRVALALDTGVRPEIAEAMARVLAAHAGTFEKLAK